MYCIVNGAVDLKEREEELLKSMEEKEAQTREEYEHRERELTKRLQEVASKGNIHSYFHSLTHSLSHFYILLCVYTFMVCAVCFDDWGVQVWKSALQHFKRLSRRRNNVFKNKSKRKTKKSMN
jgi:hypothetical protein